MESPTKMVYTRGATYGLAAVCIWAAFIVASRLGVPTSLTPWDVAAIRFSVAGILLLPYLAKRGLALDRLGWTGVTAIVAGCGAPMVLLVNVGLLFARCSRRRSVSGHDTADGRNSGLNGLEGAIQRSKKIGSLL
jgi:hypothetical protein